MSHEHHDHEHHHHQNPVEEIEKKLKELPLKERVKAVALYNYTKKKEALDLQLEKEIRQLQKQFDIKALPLYEQQHQIISGARAPTGEELVKVDTYFAENDKQFLDEVKQDSEAIVNFWGQAITNCEAIQERFNPEGKNEKDAEVLKHLQRVQVELAQDSDNFTLRFTFAPNEFFTNTDLTKTFFFREEQKCTKEHNHDHDHEHDDADFPFKTEGTEIHWNEGKDITKKVVQKKQKNKKTGASRTVNKNVDADSFFNFFRSLNLDHKAELDEETAEELEAKMEDDFEVGRTIADELIPFSLEYYLGINPDNEEDYDDEEEGDEDKDDEDGDDDDEDEGDKKKKNNKRKKSGDSGKGKKDEKEKAPDCKQQ